MTRRDDDDQLDLGWKLLLDEEPYDDSRISNLDRLRLRRLRRLAQHWEEESDDTCWTWPGTLRGGRPSVEARGHRGAVLYWPAREAWAWGHNDGRRPPYGTEVDHDCENPSCVNPAHLTARPVVEHRRITRRTRR